MGSPRNVGFISICSIGTIRVGIPSGARNTKRSAGTWGVVIMTSISTHETYLRNVISVFTASMPTHETYLRNEGWVLTALGSTYETFLRNEFIVSMTMISTYEKFLPKRIYFDLVRGSLFQL